MFPQCVHAGAEIYHIRSASELEQILKKRKKKAAKKNAENVEASPEFMYDLHGDALIS